MTELYTRLKRVLFMAGFVVALALPLMFLMENFVRDAIVAPLAYIAWIIGVVVDALPQSYLLGAIMAVAIYTAARSLSREPGPQKKERLTPAPREGNATAWYRRLVLTTKGAYSQQRLEQQIGQLILQVIAHDQRLPTREVAGRIETGEIEIPEHLKIYAEAAAYRGLPSALSLWARLKAYVVGISTPKTTGRMVAIDLDPALRYLEEQLKVKKAEEANEPNPYPVSE